MLKPTLLKDKNLASSSLIQLVGMVYFRKHLATFNSIYMATKHAINCTTQLIHHCHHKTTTNLAEKE